MSDVNAADRRAVYPSLPAFAFPGISVTYNLTHAAPTGVARLAAAFPSAALVLSFDCDATTARRYHQQTSRWPVRAASPARSLRSTEGEVALHTQRRLRDVRRPIDAPRWLTLSTPLAWPFNDEPDYLGGHVVIQRIATWPEIEESVISTSKLDETAVVAVRPHLVSILMD